MSDPDLVLRAGPWEHRMIPANGTRIHAALAGPAGGTAPLVVLLHGFPQNWFTWRHQITALAERGYRVAALDLRGYGASDKPPGRYDIPLLTDDVAAVIRSLGAARAVVVGQGLGGQIAWSMPSLTPGVVQAIGVLATPHPASLTKVATQAAPAGTLRWLARIQVPWFPERALTHGAMTHQVLRDWSAPGWQCPESEFYAASMRLSFSAHSAIEHLRWLVRSTPRSDGRAYRRAVAATVRVPVLAIHGTADRYLPVRARQWDRARTGAGYQQVAIDGAGHFLTEEAPERTAGLIGAWLEEFQRGQESGD